MMGSGKAAKCVRFYDGNACYYCPFESLDKLASNVGDLVTVLNITESIGIDADLGGPLNSIAEALEAVSGEVD